MSNVLEVEQLVKQFGPFRAVNNISFEVPKGKIIGLLGPNGAGKTTTIQILLGITLATSGSIRYFGKDFTHNRTQCLQKINFTSAFNTLMGKISVKENLIVFAKLYQVKDIKKKLADMTSFFDLAELMDKPYFELSSGQKTRVNFAKSLLNDPELLLMDEPTASLDPDIADKTLTIIEELKKTRNLSILYTSHNMSEITRICDDVIILDHGTIVAHDSPLGLTKRIPNADIRLTYEDKEGIIHDFLKEHNYKYVFHGENAVTISTEEKLIPGIIFDISKKGIWITDIEIKKPTLEDVFLQIARN